MYEISKDKYTKKSNELLDKIRSFQEQIDSSEIKTNCNKDWSKSSIRFILLNKKNTRNGFVEEDVFNRAIKLLNDNKK